MSIVKELFGKLEGKDVNLYTLTNTSGMTVKAMNLGCHIMQIRVPDRDGVMDDVVLSYDTFEEARDQSCFFGVIAGRCANRIAGSRFELGGRIYQLYANDGLNHLHGGKIGYDKKVWDDQEIEEQTSVRFTYISPDGEENYPGTLRAEVTYTLSDDNSLIIEYRAVSDADTVVNLTNHSYFNLSGHDFGPITDHYLKMNSLAYTETDSELIPTGVISKVEGTPFDFREYRCIGDRIDENHIQLNYANGYDHNFVINKNGEGIRLAASVWDKKSGRIMDVLTDLPGIQLYTGNFLDGTVVGKKGKAYEKRSGLCLETQYFPNAINQRNFLSPILLKGETYNSTTIFRFSDDKKMGFEEDDNLLKN